MLVFVVAPEDRPEGLAAELPDRALLITYQHQRDTLKHKRRLLAVLRTGRALEVPARTYGPHLGLPTRAAVWNRRTRLEEEFDDQRLARPTSRQTAVAARADGHVESWLEENRQALLEVGEVLVDHREHLLSLLSDPEQRRQLAEAIDAAGAGMAPRPSRAYASAVAYAMFLLRPGAARESGRAEVREAIGRGAGLRAGLDEVRARASAEQG